MTRFLLITLVSLSTIGQVAAQSFWNLKQRFLILSAGTGSSTYYGELTNPGTLIKYQPNFNVGLQYFVTERISVRTEANWFLLQGDDNVATDGGRRQRNLSFRSNCVELSATGSVSLYSNGPRFYRRPKINIYGFGGIGLLYFNPTADYKGQTYSLQPLRTEGVAYSLVVPVIPFGLGARLRVGPYTNIVVEAGWRKTFTDYLDDVSSKYVDNASFTDPIAKALADRRQEYDPNLPLAKAGSIRGNPNAYDSYLLLNAKIEYYLAWEPKRKGSGLVANKRNRYNSNRKSMGGYGRKKFLGIF